MDIPKIGSTVVVSNSNSPNWGSRGVVVYERQGDPLWVYSVDLEYGTPDGPYIVDFTENDVTLVKL